MGLSQMSKTFTLEDQMFHLGDRRQWGRGVGGTVLTTNHPLRVNQIRILE